MIALAALGKALLKGKAKKIAKHVIHTNINDMQISEDFQLIIGHLLMQWLSKKKVDK